jgi:hypothetical protein
MSKPLEESEKQKTSLPVTRYENPWLEAAEETSGDLSKLLKFVKGKWMVGDDVVPDGTEYVAHIDQVARGWVCFEDGKVVDRTIGKLADCFKMPKREDLPNNIRRIGTRMQRANHATRGLLNGSCLWLRWKLATCIRLSPAAKAAARRLEICAVFMGGSIATVYCQSWP